jgi:DNA-binding NarL/FixJ family response regulator
MRRSCRRNCKTAARHALNDYSDRLKPVKGSLMADGKTDQRAGPEGRTAPLSVLILDDYPIIRYGIAHLLASRSDMRVVAETGSCAIARERLDTAKPDLLLMDMDLREGCAPALILTIIKANLDTRVLVYSALSHDVHVLEAVRYGAHGYITKNAEPERLCEAIRVVARGGFYLDPAIASKVIAQLGRKHERRAQRSRELTAREVAVLHHLAAGMRNSEIARELFITERTVKYHITSMFSKLRARNRTQAVKIAIQNGLIK